MLKAVVVVVAVLTPSFLSGTHPDYHVQTGHKSATMIVVHVSRSIDDVGTGSLKSWRSKLLFPSRISHSVESVTGCKKVSQPCM